MELASGSAYVPFLSFGAACKYKTRSNPQSYHNRYRPGKITEICEKNKPFFHSFEGLRSCFFRRQQMIRF